MNPIDRLLAFLPGMKTYLTGVAMILVGLVRLISSWQMGDVFGLMFREGVDEILQGIAIITLRRGVKTDMVEAVRDPLDADEAQAERLRELSRSLTDSIETHLHGRGE